MLRELRLKFTRELAGSLAVRSVTATGIRVNNDIHESSIALTPDTLLGEWHDTPIAELTETHFARVLETNPEIVLLGTGASNIFPPRELTFAFARRNIGLEVMDTAAAARTCNVLANEGRRVAAVLCLD
jgi:uncharacterized protein